MRSKHNFAAFLPVVTALCMGGYPEMGMSQSTLPRIQQSDITYLGAFALPQGTFGNSSFDYGGHALAPYYDPATGKTTLFMEGHAQLPGRVAQVQVPATFVNSRTWSDLPKATVLQNFADITDGRLGSVDPTNQYNPTFVYGLLPYNGRIIVAASNVYSASQTVSHGVSTGLTLAGSGNFNGFYSMSATAPPRAVGGTMMSIPPEWQTAFGGKAFTGQFGLSVVSSTSAGPALTVFDPDSVGSGGSVSGKTVLHYPLTRPVCGAVNCEATQNDLYNLSTGYGGMAFPAGSRSVLFITAHGTGPYCYGTAAECNDPAMPDVKGPHAPPYRYQILAYDANDLVAVKNGTKLPSDPKPYAVFVLSGMPNSGNAFIKGAAFDQQTGNLYVTQDYGSQARIEVYHITVSGASAAQPNAPSGVSVR